MKGQDLENDVIWNSTQLMQVSKDLASYRYTLAYSLGNLFIMTLMSGGFILFEFLEHDTFLFILFWMIISILSVGIHVYIFRFAFKIVRLGPWVMVYPIVLSFGYGLNSVLNDLIPYHILWYFLLGLCSLIIGLTIEREHYLAKNLFSRPILFLGIVLLVTFPLIWYAIEFYADSQLNLVIGPAFALIFTSLSTSYSIAQAEKRVITT